MGKLLVIEGLLVAGETLLEGVGSEPDVLLGGASSFNSALVNKTVIKYTYIYIYINILYYKANYIFKISIIRKKVRKLKLYFIDYVGTKKNFWNPSPKSL